MVASNRLHSGSFVRMGLTICIVASITHAVELAAIEQNVTFGEWKRYEITARRVLPGDADLLLYLGCQDGEFRQTYGRVPGQYAIFDAAHAENLRCDGQTINGSITTGQVRHNGEYYVCSLSVSATISGSQVSGSYTGTWAKGINGDVIVVDTNAFVVPAKYLKWNTETPQAVNGTISGKVVSEQDLRTANSFAPNVDWPIWYGPNGDFSAAPSENELMDDLQDAVLLWKSEHTPPARCQSTRHGDATRFMERGWPTGGGSSPILYDGKIYFYFFRPVGEVISYQEKVELYESEAKASLVDFWRERAHDVILCLDAQTGKTLWKTAFQDSGYNLMGSKGSYTANLMAAEGRIVGSASAGKTFCLDAQTGRLLWETGLVYGTHNVIVDGVVVGYGGERRDHLVGLDLEDGRMKWDFDDIAHNVQCPQIWRHGGKQYVVVGSNGDVGDGITSQITCVDPVEGAIKWQFDSEGYLDNQLVLSGDILIVVGGIVDEFGQQGVRCYKLSELGGEFQWFTQDVFYRGTRLGTTHDGYLYMKHWGETPERVYGVVAIDMATGRPEFRRAVDFHKHGYSYYMDGRIFSETDATHTGPSTFVINNTVEDGFEVLSQGWQAPHFGTTSYHPDLMTHIFVDGRLIIRGGWGIHCYDLRKSAARAAAPSRMSVLDLCAKPILIRCESRLEVKLPRAAKSVRVSVMDQQGRTLATGKGSGKSVSLTSDVAAGVRGIVIEAERSGLSKPLQFESYS